MDTLTHALSGALLARASAPRAGDPRTLPLRRRVLVGFLAAAAPDLDFVIGYIGPIEYLYHHRGVTHSLVMLPLWAWLLALLCALAWGRDRPWRAYFGVIALSLAFHIAGDWITSFGTMIFAPFSDARYGLGATFIIDLWLTGVIIAALAVSGLWRTSRAPAVTGLAILCGYVAFQWSLMQRVIDWGAEQARAAGLASAQVTAQPRPVSPFNWMVIVREGESVRYSFVNLRRREPLRVGPDAGLIRRLDAAYLPLDRAQWVHASLYGGSEPERALAREAWQRPEFGFFRWFAQEPVFLRAETGGPQCAWFQDLRFFTPGRDRWPFRYGMCRNGSGAWQVFLQSGDARVLVR